MNIRSVDRSLRPDRYERVVTIGEEEGFLQPRHFYDWRERPILQQFPLDFNPNNDHFRHGELQHTTARLQAMYQFDISSIDK